MSSEHYGKLKSETEAEDIVTARKIVKEIVNFGVSELQKLNIIMFLAQELEDNDRMLKLVEAVKSCNAKTLLVDNVNEESEF